LKFCKPPGDTLSGDTMTDRDQAKYKPDFRIIYGAGPANHYLMVEATPPEPQEVWISSLLSDSLQPAIPDNRRTFEAIVVQNQGDH